MHTCGPPTQVEFCFTGEGSDAAPAPVSLRGLDAALYYRSGSLLNCGHAVVRSAPSAASTWAWRCSWPR